MIFLRLGVIQGARCPNTDKCVGRRVHTSSLAGGQPPFVSFNAKYGRGFSLGTAPLSTGGGEGRGKN